MNHKYRSEDLPFNPRTIEREKEVIRIRRAKRSFLERNIPFLVFLACALMIFMVLLMFLGVYWNV